jgi:hypothetical protein
VLLAYKLVIIENDFSMRIEKEIPQRPTTFPVATESTMGDLIPQIPSSAMTPIKAACLHYGCDVYGVSAAHHGRTAYSKPTQIVHHPVQPSYRDRKAHLKDLNNSRQSSISVRRDAALK